MIYQSLKINLLLFVTSTIVAISNCRVLAAETIIFEYGMATQSVSFDELEAFAETGTMSSSLKFLFDYGKQNPQIIRWILTQQFPADVKIVSNLLNTAPGEYLLGQISNTLYTRSDRANVKALRSSIVAASNDRQVSLLEVLYYYPTQQVYADGRLLFTQWRKLQNFVRKIARYSQIFG